MNVKPNIRGSIDYYYWRKPKPHKIVNGLKIYDLTEKEKKEYLKGYEEELDRKQWA